MNKQNNLTEGNIVKALVKLALPIMGTSFVQMAYNMTDMIWIGRKGSNAVAAVGTAGFFTWFAMAFILISRTGAEVSVAQAIGKKDVPEAKQFVRHTLQLNIFLGLIYGLFLITCKSYLIDFFNLEEQQTYDMAVSYLAIVAMGINFFFINPVFTGIFNGYGDSKTPFMINSIGLVVNMVLDPVLIHGIGPFPDLGVKGAAIATITAQFVVTMIFIVFFVKKLPFFTHLKLFKKPELIYLKRIMKLGLPIGIQNGLFCFFSMVLARIVAGWGDTAIAVQKVGSQIEAVSWMTAGGFSTSLSTFVGQNYGANRWDRIHKGYTKALWSVSFIGIAASLLLILGARPIFAFFIPEEDAIKLGIEYLHILGLSQLFMCLEITTTGAFNGLGKTMPPSIISTIITGMRIPLAMILSSIPFFALNGVWWSITITSVVKGILLTCIFVIFLNKQSRVKVSNNFS